MMESKYLLNSDTSGTGNCKFKIINYPKILKDGSANYFPILLRNGDNMITLKNKLIYKCPFEKIHIIHLDDLSPGFGRDTL